MLRELDNLRHELKAEKVQVRQKAFTKLYDVLNGRLSELQKNLDQSDDITWESLFKAAHHGVLLHSQKLFNANTDLQENDTKITSYSKVLLKICDSCANVKNGIPYKVLVTLANDVLRDECSLVYFGKCYVQLLQNSVLKPGNNLTTIPLSLWKGILEILFKVMKSKRHMIPFLEIIFCTQQVVQLGCAFSQLAEDLQKYLDILTVRLEKNAIEREKIELLVIAYHCCRNIAVDYRFEVCRFTEINAKHIHSLFKVDLNEEKKEVLFKLMDLALIVHYPKISSNKSDQEFIYDRKIWHPQLQNFAYIAGLELKLAPKSNYRSHSNQGHLNHVFVQFAARLCYVVYWDDSVWQEEEEDDDGASVAKRIKRANKLQTLIDFAQPSIDKSECNWKWIMIISEVIYNYPSALGMEDFQTVLQMLSVAQSSISSELEVYAFTKCCYVLLQRDKDYSATANNIIVNHCKELWHRIAEGAARVCTLNNKQALESHALLQTLIHHEKNPSHTFIEDVIKLFLTNSTIKCDGTLLTLVTVMKAFNLDSLPNGKDLAKQILVYTFKKPTIANLKKIITTDNGGKPSNYVVSLVGAICCLSKTDIVNHSKKESFDADKLFQDNWKLEQQMLYKKEVAEIINLILMKCNECLLIEDEDFLEVEDEETVDQSQNEFPTEIECILDQELFEELQRLTEVKEKILDETRDTDEIKDYLAQIIENTDVLMNLAHNFIKFHALNEEKFTSSFIAKKIDFNMQLIEQLFGLIIRKQTSSLELKETTKLLNLVKSLFSSKFHSKISLRIRSFELENCLLWIGKQVRHKFLVRDDDTEVNNKIGWNEFVNAKMEAKLKFLAIETLFEYNNCKGINEETFINRVEQINIDVNDNMDLHTVFHVLNIIGRQASLPRSAVDWIWKYVIAICRHHHNNQYLSHQLFKSFKDIVSMSKDHDDMTSNVVALFSSFSKLCAQQSYSECATVTFIQQFKFFHKRHFTLYDEDAVADMYEVVYNNFLNSNFFAIKMSAIKTIAAILHNDIEDVHKELLLHSNRNNKRTIFETILTAQCITNNQMETDDATISDEEANLISKSFQLFSSLFCVNFVFRKPLIMEISKLLVRFKISEPVAMSVYNKILKFLRCDSQSLMDTKSIVHWVSEWILDGNNLVLFPWYFAGAESMHGFCNLHYGLISFAMLKNNVSKIDDFSLQAEIPVKSLITEILPECLSYMLPIEAGCSGIKYAAKAEKMKAKLDSCIDANQQKLTLLRKTSSVFGFLLENVYDDSKFKEICGFNFEVTSSVEMINCADFDRCLNHVKKIYSIPAINANQSILTFFCTKQTHAHFIEKLLRILKRKVQSTRLKEHKLLYLLQYCIFVGKLLEYLNEPLAATFYDIKGFIIRDITNFLCHLLLDATYGTKMRETASNFLSIFLNKILPICANDLKPFLNKIISSLVSICKKFKGEGKTDFEAKCFSIIELLVIRHSLDLEDEIVNLDMFPDNTTFHEVREKQLQIKYKNGKFTLTQEIEHFLKVKKRMVEGLIELRTHLADKKAELKVLFDQLTSTMGFSEDGEKNILHQLIRSLIGYARNLPDIPENEERAIEAVKCLGEIGNYDLSTMVFVTEDHKITTVYQKIDDMSQCHSMICHAVLDQMETMILHPNPRIFDAASSACYSLLTSQSSHGYRECIYLRPFNTKTLSRETVFYTSPKANKTMNFIEILQNNEYSTYKTWIKRICGEMLIFSGNKTLELVTSAQKCFAEMLSTLMVQLLLCYNVGNVNDMIISGVNFFFTETAEKMNYPKVNEGSMYLNKLAIRQMLQVAECIRMHCLDHPKSELAKTLDLDYLNIAKAAKFCEAFFTAVLYCEMWAEQKLKTENISYATSMNHKTLQEIMYESFTAIGIHDASNLFINPFTNRSLYLQSRNRNWQNILEHDSMGDLNQSEGYNTLANDLGLHLLSKSLAKSQTQSSRQYECLWRLSDWNVLIQGESETKDESAVVDYREEFEKFHYAGLKGMKNGDELGVKIAVNKARKSILQMLQQESLECTKNLNKFLGMSQLLQQVEDFAQVRFNRQLQDSHVGLQKKWDLQNQLPHDFRLIEPVLSQRNAIFDTANIRAGRRTWIPEALQSNMLYIVKESLEAGCEADAVKTIAKLRNLPNLTKTNKAEMLIREAQLNFKSNVHLSKFCLKRLLEDKEFEREILQKSFAYLLYGEILADNFAENIDKINEDYFTCSIKHLEHYAAHNHKSHLVLQVNPQLSQSSQPLTQEEVGDDADEKIKERIGVFETVAKYFDREYVSKSEYILSTDFKNKKIAFEKNKEKLPIFYEAYRADKSNKEKGKSYMIMQKSLEIDRVEIESVLKECKRAAGLAVMHYLRSIINETGFSTLSIFRIVSIWLSNLNWITIRQMINTCVDKIPSHKFIFVLPQLVVRLNEKTSDPSNQLLMKIIQRCAIDHPHHTLPLILALVNSYADSPDQNSSEQAEPRVVGANVLWSKLKSTQLGTKTLQMELMTSALINLANKDVDKMPKGHGLIALKSLDQLQCPTMDLPIRENGNYKQFETTVVKWVPEFEKVGGINAPKKIFCVCSDGVTRAQLIKGRDDMRQDAVMQQVFSAVNQMLNGNKEMSKRHARVRTYKVVPFSRRSGILEWCNDTIPIGTYLCGDRSSKDPVKSKGAHERYNPQDWKPSDCLAKIHACDSASFEKKEEVFKEVCENIQPVLHHFFNENFKNPGKWFERRLSYTTSVAVSSIVGYILGIGDRHVQNILIDYKSAEIVHIDFGIAFEQGKILPHKELIPFRLTRDITAPMGICGVDGVFRKTCEKTMEILRANEKTLTTILEILLYDPMYTWTVSTKKAQQRQLGDASDATTSDDGMKDDDRDSMASRALLRVQAKLKGQADDSVGYASVEGQVECLIQMAMNKSLLSRLFRGWQAYL